MARALNPKAGPRKGAKHGEELVQRSRAAVLNALDVVEKRGKLISEILADAFEENPLKFMELAAKLSPKDVSGTIGHDHRHTHEPVSETADWIAEVIREPEDKPPSLPSPH